MTGYFVLLWVALAVSPSHSSVSVSTGSERFGTMQACTEAGAKMVASVAGAPVRIGFTCSAQ